MFCIVEHADPRDARDVERILGALASLTAAPGERDADAVITFRAPPGTAHLVIRALEAMAASDRRQARARRHALARR